VLAYEYVEDQEPYLFEVNPFAIGSPHQVHYWNLQPIESGQHLKTYSSFPGSGLPP